MAIGAIQGQQLRLVEEIVTEELTARSFPQGNNPDLSLLELCLYEVDQKIAVVFIEEGGTFGSLFTSNCAKKFLTEMKQINTRGYYVLPVLDGGSKHSMLSLFEEEEKGIDAWIRAEPNHEIPGLTTLKQQLSPKRGGRKVRLSKAENIIYNLQVQNNKDEVMHWLGAWMAYYTPEDGFYVEKVEPIQIIGHCLNCDYLVGQYESQRQAFPVQDVRKQMHRKGNSRPDLCQDYNCWKHKGRPGEPYRNFRYAISQELSPENHRLIVEQTPGGLNLAKFVGCLYSGHFSGTK
ncbi:hypothetical protein JXC34_03520 [Candidatus Woesearchaeota archaeon]|nr:hypothetical protein [Candidatus Woesearchaeota archaeon]